MLKFANKICSNDILPFDARCSAKSILQNKFKIVKTILATNFSISINNYAPLHFIVFSFLGFVMATDPI
jgi:hypothetical protein